MISDDCAVVQGILGHARSLLDPGQPPQLPGNPVEPMGIGEAPDPFERATPATEGE